MAMEAAATAEEDTAWRSKALADYMAFRKDHGGRQGKPITPIERWNLLGMVLNRIAGIPAAFGERQRLRLRDSCQGHS